MLCVCVCVCVCVCGLASSFQCTQVVGASGAGVALAKVLLLCLFPFCSSSSSFPFVFFLVVCVLDELIVVCIALPWPWLLLRIWPAESANHRKQTKQHTKLAHTTTKNKKQKGEEKRNEIPEIVTLQTNRSHPPTFLRGWGSLDEFWLRVLCCAVLGQCVLWGWGKCQRLHTRCTGPVAQFPNGILAKTPT